MRIQLETEGGLAHFPGLAGPFVLDTSSLPAAEAAEFETLVRAARFSSLPARVGGAAGAADFRTYTLSVTDGAQVHTVVAVEPIGDPALEALIDRLRARQKQPR